jgi:hypothetical protein
LGTSIEVGAPLVGALQGAGTRPAPTVPETGQFWARQLR